jgi:hypothetical protein
VSYKVAADALTEPGYPTKEQDFKNALRHKEPPPEHTIPPEADGIAEFVRGPCSAYGPISTACAWLLL